jgi:hypothetical protein
MSLRQSTVSQAFNLSYSSGDGDYEKSQFEASQGQKVSEIPS